MSSNPIDRGALLAGTADSHRRWWKRALPRSLFGRSLIIIILPLVLVQLIATWIFYDRHWATVERRLAANVAADIAFTLDSRTDAVTVEQVDALLWRAEQTTDLRYTF